MKWTCIRCWLSTILGYLMDVWKVIYPEPAPGFLLPPFPYFRKRQAHPCICSRKKTLVSSWNDLCLMPQIQSISKSSQLEFKNRSGIWPLLITSPVIGQVQATIFCYLDDYNSSHPCLLLQSILNTVARMILLKYKPMLLLCEIPSAGPVSLTAIAKLCCSQKPNRFLCIFKHGYYILKGLLHCNSIYLHFCLSCMLQFSQFLFYIICDH